MKKKFENKLLFLVNYVRSLILNDELRQQFMFKWMNIILSCVSLFMTVVNIFTKEWPLMYSTLIFGVLAMINVFIVHFKPRLQPVIRILFFLEVGALLLFFTITGHPDGFSVLWLCLIPSFVLCIFGRKLGSIVCGIAFLAVIFLFWIPVGRNLLQFDYNSTFLLRFPFLFLAIYLLSLFIETIRAETQRQLYKIETKYKYLYRHDALTNLYNRYGFNEAIQHIFSNDEINKLSLMIFDIDNFKMVNDKYGHDIGDEVLKNMSSIMKEIFCEHTFYSRWGGEEFTALLTCNHDPLEMAELLRKTINERIWKIEKYDVHITVSIGLCIVENKQSINAATLLKIADQCLYQAKKSGKNCVINQVIK